MQDLSPHNPLLHFIKVVLNFSDEDDLKISCDTFLIVTVIKHWDFLLVTQHFPPCIYTSTKRLQHVNTTYFYMYDRILSFPVKMYYFMSCH